MQKELHELFPHQGESGRAIAIVGGAFLETMLEHILLAFLPENGKESARLMEVNQPLGNFSNKISMCYCLGLIESIIRHDLNIIRKIRNKFAHNLHVSFDDEEIRSLCAELKWHKISLYQRPPLEATSRDIFQVGVNQLIAHLHGCIGIARKDRRTILNNYNT